MLGDRQSVDVLHHEVRPSLGRRPGVEHPGDVRMIHERQRLALLLEAGDDRLGVHALLDDLERHSAAQRLRLLGVPDLSHPALADLLDEAVGADLDGGARAGRLARVGRRLRRSGASVRWGRVHGRIISDGCEASGRSPGGGARLSSLDSIRSAANDQCTNVRRQQGSTARMRRTLKESRYTTRDQRQRPRAALRTGTIGRINRARARRGGGVDGGGAGGA